MNLQFSAIINYVAPFIVQGCLHCQHVEHNKTLINHTMVLQGVLYSTQVLLISFFNLLKCIL